MVCGVVAGRDPDVLVPRLHRHSHACACAPLLSNSEVERWVEFSSQARVTPRTQLLITAKH